MLIFVSFLLCMGSFVSGDLTPCIDKQRQALLLIKANLDDIHNSNLSDWGNHSDCCKWSGVSCAYTGHVIELDLSNSANRLSGKFSPSFQLLTQLRVLNLRGIDFQFNSIPNFFGSLTNLISLDISSANLSGPIPKQLGNLYNLLHLDLSHNFLIGPVPFSLGDLASLTHLNISDNQLGGAISSSFGNSSSLVELNLSENFLNGSLPNFVGCSSMEELILHHNSFNGSIPDLTGCQSLRTLDLSDNRLSGDLPKSVGKLSNLEYLKVSSNYLKGVISDLHFQNLSELTNLDLSFNSFRFELSSDANIPFQLNTIKLQACKLGPGFPVWIKTQRYFQYLDISNAGILDSVPEWFWDLPVGLEFLNLSSNEIKGTLPNNTVTFLSYPGMDLSNNRLEGRVSTLPSRLAALNLSGNKLSGSLGFLCQIDGFLTFLDLSSNSFSGTLPNCWLKFGENLVVLSLSNNSLSGEIPSSLGFLSQLEALYLRSNAFVGELPMSLSNCTKLRFADFGINRLSGNIPAWIGGRLSELYVLVLRSNRFYGSLPSEICLLSNLQFLDLSENELSGNIPRCFGNLTAMARKGVGIDITNHSYSSYIGRLTPLDPESIQYGLYPKKPRSCKLNFPCPRFSDEIDNIWKPSEISLYFDKTVVAWKGKDREFGRSGLELLKNIDLSSNNLSGRLPNEITRLVELVSLNVSINKLHGAVPKDMGRLKSLDCLDLSQNNFSGHIPSSLSQVDQLAYLDLSNNNLSGRIPTGTQLQGFNRSVYRGNPLLCGPPLTPKCGFISVGPEDDEKDDIWTSYYTGMASGFGVGFWGICSLIFLNRRCRHLVFGLLSHVNDWIYVRVALHFKKLQTKFTR